MRWLAIILCLLSAGHSFAAQPFARIELEEKGKIVPGQQVRLDVTVFAPDFFTSPPQFPLFDLPNALVTLPDERAENSSETVDGVQYSGIRRVYAIVPETSGIFTLPAVAIELGYSADGRPVRGLATLPAFEFAVAEGSAAPGNALSFAARQLTLSQSFDRDPTALTVGDALVRTITVFAEDTQAMMIPSVDVGQAAGVKQYAATSRIDDNVSLGREIGSRRIQTITYTMVSAGRFVIPDISYAWYDTDAARQSAATLPMVKISVAAAPASADGIAPTLETASGLNPPLTRRITAVLVSLLFGGWLIWGARHRMPRLIGRWAAAYRNSDFRSSALLRKTIGNGTLQEIEAQLREWSRRQGYSSLPDWADESAALRSQVENLQRLLYADNPAGIVLDRQALARSVSQVRTPNASRHTVRSHLPALNPGEVRSSRRTARSSSTGQSAR